MAAWFGFSDDDLKRVKNVAEKSNDQPRKSNESHKKATLAAVKRPQHGKPTRPTTQTAAMEIDTSMRLQKVPTNQTNESSSHRIPKGRQEIKHENETSVENHIQNEATVEKEVESLDDKEGFDRDMMSLEKFREQQKAIEEANKQKKALLSKTISERRKKARAEAHKLEHIQKELSKLDQLLSSDVEVIRNKIEDISMKYMEAERRFQRAEAEYIAAKIDMHQKSEQKETLTEHMYTIIHQNEVRKAMKLAELMKEMEMECSEEDLQMPELPPLSSFQHNPVLTSTTGLKPLEKQPESSNTGEKSSDANGDCIKVEKDLTNDDLNDKNQKTDSEPSTNKATESVQGSVPSEKSVESQKCESPKTAETEQAVDLSVVKQEPVDEPENVTQSDSSGQGYLVVKTEVNDEENSPKAPSKWDFDGSLS